MKKCRTWDILTSHNYFVLQGRRTLWNAYQFSRKLVTKIEIPGSCDIKKIYLPKFCIKYNRTFITQRQEAQLWIIKFRDNYYSKNGFEKYRCAFVMHRCQISRKFNSHLHEFLHVHNSCSLTRSDLSLWDLQFYEYRMESVNEICTGHLKTSGFRWRSWLAYTATARTINYSPSSRVWFKIIASVCSRITGCNILLFRITQSRIRPLLSQVIV